MAFDGLVTRAVVCELTEKLIGGKIDKIYQPQKDELVICVRNNGEAYRLLLTANANSPRVHLTRAQRENPASPPMFCMLLRKHLTGGRIAGINQIEFDRVIKIDVESYTELGDLTVKSVMIEIMGKHSNIILIDDGGKILDSIKHIDFTVSSVRQILPGLYYEVPPSQNKLNPITVGVEGIYEAFSNPVIGIRLDKLLIETFMGISPLIARELVFGCFGNAHYLTSNEGLDKFILHLMDFFKNIYNNRYVPVVAYDAASKKPTAFSCIDIRQYNGTATVRYFDGISEAIDDYFYDKDVSEQMSQRSHELIRLVNNNIERCEKKILLHQESLANAQNREQYKIFGDLLTANMYKLNYGMENAELQNFYDEYNGTVVIPLQADMSPSQNAQRYYTLYNKAKTSEKYAKEQLEKAIDEREYLETVLEAAQNAQSSAEISEIKEELTDEGYINVKNSGKAVKKKIKAKTEISEFMSPDGFVILVGKNNRQNDYVTFKMAFSDDIWLHTKAIAGSHTIIRTQGGMEVPSTTLQAAAKLAAHFSRGRMSSNVAVDYTQVKNVKKPNGAKPGKVIYDNYGTVYVTPCPPADICPFHRCGGTELPKA